MKRDFIRNKGVNKCANERKQFVEMQSLRKWAKKFKDRQISRAVEVTDGVEVEFGVANSTESFTLVISNESNRTIKVERVHTKMGSLVTFRSREQQGVNIRPNRDLTLYFDVQRRSNVTDATEIIRMHLSIGIIMRKIKIIFDRNAFIRKQYQHKLYDIPEVFREIIDSVASYEDSMLAFDGLIPKAEDLRFDNYGEHFHGLLHLERIGMERSIKVYNQREAYFLKIKNGYKIEIEDLFETRPSLSIGDRIHARKKIDIQTEYVGRVIDLNEDHAVVTFEPNFDRAFNSEGYRVEFSFNAMYYHRLHCIIDIATKMFNENFLFPNALMKSGITQLNVYLDMMGQLRYKKNNILLPWFNQDLNNYQKEAVLNVLRGECRQMPYIIYGPPGTGKTTTLTEIILQLDQNMPQSRILIAAQSNSSANLLAQRLISSGMLRCSELLRLTSYSFSRGDKMPETLIEYSAVYCPNKLPLDNNDEFETQTKILKIYDINLLRAYRMIVGTTGSMIPLIEDSKISFTHVIIDEGGQCTEVDALIPILMTGMNGQTIMAGDPKQMPPIIIDEFARDRGLANSLMCRLFERYSKIDDDTLMMFDDFGGYNPKLITRLRYNYRSLPGILDFVNTNFYNGELLPKVSAKTGEVALTLKKLISDGIIPHGLANCGLYFRNVNGTNEKLATTSWCNREEAYHVSTLVATLISAGIRESDIGVITPYSLQVKMLKDVIINRHKSNITIGTVEEFQGQERLVILLSTVRTCRRNAKLDTNRRLGFVGCPKRLNVAVSRARALFYVFGQADLLSMDLFWERFIEECKSNNTYISG